MNFMSAAISCAVYFFTSVWSAGLNRSQIETCIKLYTNPRAIPTTMRKDFGIEYPERVFKYDSKKHSYINVKDLLLVLAYEGTVYSFEEPMLTSFEVEYYVKKFIKHAENLGHDGWLVRDEIIDLYESLNITGYQLANAIDLIPFSQQGGGFSTQVEFLLVMLDMLPEGNGLSQTQIEEFINLYEFNKTKSESFMPSLIQSIFKVFDMPQQESFKANRPAAIELMELMIVTAERSTRDHKKNDLMLSTKEVRSLIYKFTQFDTNHDGLLTGDEMKDFMEEFFPIDPDVSRIDHSDANPPILPLIFIVLSEDEVEKLLDVFKLEKKKPLSPTNISFEDAEINVAQYLLFYAFKPRVE